MAAFKTSMLSFLSSVWFLVSCAADEQNLSEVNCRVLPVGENLASEFKLKASEKGVRMIYMNLEMGNDSYNPLELQDEILPDRWVWARSSSEPMLSLPYDYDILSLGLLNYQVQSMTVPLRDQPSGCLAGLNSTSQNMAVGRALLDNVTFDISGQLSPKSGVVCVAMIENKDIKYHCCSANGPAVYCDLPVEDSNWFYAFKIVLAFLSFVMLQYWPALLLILPDCIFNLRHECKKEHCTKYQLTNSVQPESTAILNHKRNGYEQIQNDIEEGFLVDDASPVTCSNFLLRYVQRLPDIRPSFNVKLTVLLFCICPFFFYVHLGLFLKLKQKFIYECFMKSVEASNVGFSFQLYINSPETKVALSILAFTCFMLAFCLRPTDLFLQWEAMEGCPVCIIAKMMSVKPLITETSTDSINICDKMHEHLKLAQKVVYFLMRFFLDRHNSGLTLLTNKYNSCCFLTNGGSRIIRALFILGHLISTLSMLFFGLVLGAICLFLFVFIMLIFVLLCFTPFVTVFIFFMLKIYREMRASFCKCQLYYLHLVLLFFFAFGFLLEIVTFSIVLIICYFILGMVGFTIMGLVLNMEIVTPYVAFFLVVTTNIYFCYANLQSRYKEVKGLILKYWQQELQTTNSDQSKIPRELFWFVCDETFPVETEVCLMLFKMSVILTFLFLAISSIIFFRNTYDISTLVSTIFVFISGTIPSLFFKGLTRGNNFTSLGKLKLKGGIEMTVKEYLRQSGRNESEEGRSLDNSVVV